MKLPAISRRKLLWIISLLTVSPALKFSEVTAGLIHRSGLSFNGGKTQTNAEGMLTAGMFPFLNLMLQATTSTYISPPTDPNVPRVPVTELDANGYPTSIVAGTGGVQYQSFYLFPTAIYSGVYVLLWDGGGTLVVPGNGSTTGYIPNTGFSFSNLTSGNTLNNRFEFTLQADSVANSIQTTATSAAPNNVRNIRLYRKTDETLVNAGQVFGVDFLAKMRQAKPGCIRSLGWIGSSSNGTNDCSIALWAQRKPRNYYSYRAAQFFPSAYQGTATQSGNSFTLSGVSLTDKMLGHFFAGGSAANPLNLSSGCAISNSSVTGLAAAITITSHATVIGDIYTFGNTGGAVPSPFIAGNIYYVQNVVDANNINLSATLGGSAISTTAAGTSVAVGLWMSLSVDGGATRYLMTGQLFPASNQSNPGFSLSSIGKVAANTVCTYIFDQTTQTFNLTVDGSANPSNTGFFNGTPVETFIDFCAAIGAHPWVIMPWLTMESAASINSVTDFASNCLSYIRSSYSYMVPVIEPPNETWNGGSIPFRSTFYTVAVAWNRWAITADSTNQVYGMWASKLAQATASFYSADYSKFFSLCSFQTSPPIGGGTGGQNNRLLSPQYVSSNGGNAAFAAYNQCNAACVDNYVAPAELYSCQELIDGFGWTVTNAANPGAQSAIAEAYVATLSGSSPSSAQTISYRVTCYNNLIGYIQTLTGTKITTIVGYEGGYSPDYFASASGNSIAWKTVITSATQANPCVLTLAAVSSNPKLSVGSGVLTGNPAVIGMSISPSGSLGMTGLNLADSITATFSASSANIIVSSGTFSVGNAVCFNNWTANINAGAMPGALVQGQPYYVVSSVGSVIQVSATKGGSAITITTAPLGTVQIQQCYVVLAVSGNQVTIDFDASAQPAYTGSSGSVNYTFSGSLSNNLRWAGKFTNQAGVQTTAFMAAWNALSGLTPKYFSNFVYFGTGTVWPVLDPSIYTPNTPQWNSIVSANN